MGSVRATPITTDTTMPIQKGWSTVAHLTKSPTAEAAAPMGAAITLARPTPTSTVTMGVTRMSTLVSLDTSFPHSAAPMATKYTASGPPAPPMALAANPTGIRENSTMDGQCRAKPMATAIPGPTIAEARPPMV